MLSRIIAISLFAAFIQAQTLAPVKIEVRTEAAICDAIASGSACLGYTQPPFPQTVGVKSPEFAIVRVTGPEGAASVIQAVVISPGNRQWLRVRRAGAPVGGVSISDQLPQDVEIYVDETQALEMHAGRFVATLVVTASGVAAPMRLPVQLTIGPGADVITATPDSLSDQTFNADQSPQPVRFGVSVRRNGVGPPVQVSVTPATSDGGSWLTSDAQQGFAPCSTSPVPCEFDAIVAAPSTAGDYWGALIVTGAGYADRVAVRVKVNPSAGANPPTIQPSQVSFSASAGSTLSSSALVELKGGYDGVSFRAVKTANWLTVDPVAGRWPLVLKLTANPTGLEAGLYNDVVELRTQDTSELLGSIGITFTITAPIYLPTLLDGGGWRSTLYLVNPGAKEVKANLRFWNTPRDKAEPWLIGLEGRGLVTSLEKETIPPLGLRVIETQGAQANRQQGWAELTADGTVAMHVVLSEARSSRASGDATLPVANALRDRLLLPFDNLGDGSASISLANPEDQAVTVAVVSLNENGVELAREGNFTLPARGMATFESSVKWPSTTKRRGVLALDFDGHRLHVTGLRALGSGFYAYPAVPRGELSAERGIPRVVAGGGWQSTAYLTNSTSLVQPGALRLWPDLSRGAPDAGLREESALPVPANGVLVWQAAQNAESRTDAGWLESRYPKQVGGFMLLRQNPAGAPPPGAQRFESALSGQAGLVGRIAIPFDYRGSTSTEIVLVNTSDDPTDIQTVVYDLAGRFPRFGETFTLGGKARISINGADRWELGGQQGVLGFASRQSFRLTGVGLRYGDGAVTILPAFEK